MIADFAKQTVQEREARSEYREFPDFAKQTREGSLWVVPDFAKQTGQKREARSEKREFQRCTAPAGRTVPFEVLELLCSRRSMAVTYRCILVCSSACLRKARPRASSKSVGGRRTG